MEEEKKKKRIREEVTEKSFSVSGAACSGRGGGNRVSRIVRDRGIIIIALLMVTHTHHPSSQTCTAKKKNPTGTRIAS